jgi:hypothetical protein
MIFYFHFFTFLKHKSIFELCYGFSLFFFHYEFKLIIMIIMIIILRAS